MLSTDGRHEANAQAIYLLCYYHEQSAKHGANSYRYKKELISISSRGHAFESLIYPHEKYRLWFPRGLRRWMSINATTTLRFGSWLTYKRSLLRKRQLNSWSVRLTSPSTILFNWKSRYAIFYPEPTTITRTRPNKHLKNKKFMDEVELGHLWSDR